MSAAVKKKIIEAFTADSTLAALASGGIHLDESLPETDINRIVFSEDDSGRTITRNYCGRTESWLFYFVIYGDSLETNKAIYDRFLTVYQTDWNPTYTTGVNGGARVLEEGIRDYEQQSPQRAEDTVKPVYITVIPWRCLVNY